MHGQLYLPSVCGITKSNWKSWRAAKWVWRCTGLWFCVTLCGNSKGWRNLSYSKNPVSLALPWGLHSRESREQALCLWKPEDVQYRLTMREQESTQMVFKGEDLGLYRTKFIRDHDPLFLLLFRIKTILMIWRDVWNPLNRNLRTKIMSTLL